MNLYQRISKDNRSKYGTEFEKVLKIIINQYSDRTHFIYEILQNAEDAGATHIRFRLERDRLEICHNGRPFDEKDIEGVCGIASGTKEDGTRIGHFGIGFKSVYCYTDKPRIYSGQHHFAIVNRLFPEEVNGIVGLPGSETCLILPFDREDVSAKVAYQEIRDALTRKISADSLLMLRHIADVNIEITGHPDIITINKERYPLDSAFPENIFALSAQTTYRQAQSGKERHRDADYLFFTDAERDAVAIVFNVDGKELKPIRNSMIYAWFPTAKESHQGFYIHAPFDTTPARDNFKEGQEYGRNNLLLVKRVCKLIWFAFSWMRDHHYLSVSGFRNVFPIHAYEEDDILYGIYQNSIEIVEEEAIIPTNTAGGFKSLSDIAYPASGNMLDVFSDDDLHRLTGQINLCWIAREFTIDAYGEIRAFLNERRRMTRVEWKTLVQKMDARFLKEKSLDWMERLMLRIEGLCTPRSDNDAHSINADRIPFVRTRTGDQICARDDRGRLQVYLNNPEIAKNIIDSRFLSSDVVKSFYQRVLRIPEYNVEREAVDNILPKYVSRKPAFRTGDPIQENIEDLKTIKDAVYINPRVLEMIADKYIVTDGHEWFRPYELYIRSDDRRAGYALVKGIIPIHYIADAYTADSLSSLKLDEAFFRKIGCSDGIRAVKVDKEAYLDLVAAYQGASCSAALRRGVFAKRYISQKFDWAFNYEGFPAVFRDMTPERSIAIARFLNPNVERFSIRGDLVGAEDQHFSGRYVYTAEAYSMLGLQLSYAKWIYVKGDPNPYCPLDVDRADILDEYHKFAKRLVDMLPFKEVKNALTDWLDSTFDDQRDLELVKRLMANPEGLVKIARAKARSDAKADAKKEQRSIRDLLEEGDKKQKGSMDTPESDIAPISEAAKEKREKKLDEAFAASLDQFLGVARAARGLSFSRRESSPEERLFLEQEYGGLCQICQKRITKYDGEPYFEAINIIKNRDLDERLRPTIQYGWNSLCLCPNCAAEYNHCSKKISTLYEQVMNLEIEAGSDDAIRINVEMPEGRPRTIAYSPRHMLALQRALIAFTTERST